MQQNDSPNINTQSGTPLPPSLSIIDLLLIIVRYKRSILFTTIGSALLTTLITLLLPSFYTSTTLILPSEDDKAGMSAMMAQLGGLAGLAGSSLGGPSKTELYVTMLKSEAVKDPIIDRFKLMDVYKVKYRTDAYKELTAKALVSSGKKDGIISIAVTDKDPKRATEIANGYAEELGKLATRLTITSASQNRHFLEERLAAVKAEAIRAGDQLKAFQTKNKMVNVTDQAKAAIEGVAQLRGQLAVQEVQLASVQRQFTEESQEVKRVKTAVNNLKTQIARLEGGSGNSSIPSVGTVPQLGQDYLRLMRDAKIQETMVELLTKQYEMARLSESKDMSPFQVLQKAKIPERKSKPARAKIILMVTFCACFISLFVAFVREYFANLPKEEQDRWKSLRSTRSL